MALSTSTSYDLGQLGLSMKSSGLQLQMSNTAIFDPPAEGCFDSKDLHLDDLLPSGKAWVVRGTASRLILDIDLEDILDVRGRDLLFGVVAERLREAKASLEKSLRQSAMLLTSRRCGNSFD